MIIPNQEDKQDFTNLEKTNNCIHNMYTFRIFVLNTMVFNENCRKIEEKLRIEDKACLIYTEAGK